MIYLIGGGAKGRKEYPLSAGCIQTDVPLWSEFIRQEANRFGYPYIDMTGVFSSPLQEAEATLTVNLG